MSRRVLPRESKKGKGGEGLVWIRRGKEGCRRVRRRRESERVARERKGKVEKWGIQIAKESNGSEREIKVTKESKNGKGEKMR